MEQFRPLPFSAAKNEKSGSETKSSTYSEAESFKETSGLLGKQTVQSPSIGSSILRSQKPQSTPDSHTNKFLDSMLLRNAELQSSSGIRFDCPLVLCQNGFLTSFKSSILLHSYCIFLASLSPSYGLRSSSASHNNLIQIYLNDVEPLF